MHEIVATVGFLLISFWTPVNIVRAMAKTTIPPANFVFMAAGWTAFIWAIWLHRL